MELGSPGHNQYLKIGIKWLFLLVLSCSNVHAGKKCPDDDDYVTPVAKEIKSYGYESGAYKKNMKCEWRLSAANTSLKIRVDIMYLDLEEEMEKEKDKECHDYLVIYDGYDDDYPKFPVLCGNKRDVSLVSRSTYLYFKFHSDESVSKKGFWLKYYAVPFSMRSFGPDDEKDRQDASLVPTTEPPKKKKMEHSYIIIGSVFGCVCAVAIIIVIVCLCMSHKTCSCCRNSGTPESSVAPASHREGRRRRRRSNRVQQTNSSGSFENFCRTWPPQEMYVMSPLPPYSPPSPPPYSPYQETELTVYPSAPELTIFPPVTGVREHQPLPASPPPSYSSQDLPPCFSNSLYDSQPPNLVYPPHHQRLERTYT